ncbi:MAG: glycosyltransferase family 39 protein [Deltaproteobacteria bacterium]|nr:glycosyltransferase family 39 protein [Deltaproteobacteria bacterium]
MDEDRIRDFAVPVCIALLSVIAQWTIHDRALVPMDEGHLAAAADWLLDGKRLYRDIHTGIFPGIYLITAGLFALFGEDMWVTRLAAVATNAATSLTLWWIARRMVRTHWALLVPLFHMALIVVSFPVLSIFNYSTLAVCFGLIALLFLLRYLEGGRRLDALWLGLFVAAAVFTKQNFGFLIFVSLGVGLLSSWKESALDNRTLVSVLLPIAVSGAALTLVLVSFFVATGTVHDWLDASVFSLGGSQLKHFNNPMPPILGPHPDHDGRFIFLYSPPTIFNALVHGEPWAGITIVPWFRSFAIRASYGLPLLAVLVSLPVLWGTRGWDDTEPARANRCALLFGVLFFPGIFPSAIWSHLAFVGVPTLLLFSFLADRLESALDRLAPGTSWPGWSLRGAAGVLALVATVVCIRISRDVARWNPVSLELPRASLRVSEQQADLLGGAVRFVNRCAQEDEPILALPDIPIVYFLTNRPNASPYDLTIPGNVDGALIAQRIDEVPIRCIVMNPQMYPEFPAFKLLFPVLARHIELNFVRDEMIVGGRSHWVGLVRGGPTVR